MSNLLAFLTSEFRYLDAKSEAIRAQYTTTAQGVVINTNLDEVGAQRRADEELAAGKTTRVFEITVEQLFLPDDFIGAPPRFAIYSPADNLDGEEFTAFEVASVNLTNGTSTLRVR